MLLTDAASYFDSNKFYNAYSPTTYILGQLELYNDSMRDGMSSQRRIISLDPSVSIPARGCINIDDVTYVVGEDNVDIHENETLRHKYIVHRADGLAEIKTLAQVISATTGVQAYTGVVRLKSFRDEKYSSERYSEFSLFFNSAESVLPEQFITLDGKIYRVNVSYTSEGGFIVAESFELPSTALTTADYNFTEATYDSATDTYPTDIASSVTDIPVLWERYTTSYTRPTKATEKYEEGDIKLSLLKSDVATISKEHTITVLGDTWQIVGYFDVDASVWGLHLRRD